MIVFGVACQWRVTVTVESERISSLCPRFCICNKNPRQDFSCRVVSFCSISSVHHLVFYHLQLCCRVPRSCVDLRQSAGDRAPRHVQLHRDVNLRCLFDDIAPDDLRILLAVTCLCYDLLPLALQQAGQIIRNPHPRADRHHLQSGWRGTRGATAYDSGSECSLYC